MGKSRFTTSSRKKQRIPIGAVCVEQSTGKLSSALLSCTTTETGKKEKLQNCETNQSEWYPHSAVCLTCPLWRRPGKGFIPVITFRVCFLVFPSKRSLKNLQESLFWLFIFPTNIFRTNLMLELDSRGIQFPGHNPAMTACSFACLIPGIFALCAVWL